MSTTMMDKLQQAAFIEKTKLEKTYQIYGYNLDDVTVAVSNISYRNNTLDFVVKIAKKCDNLQNTLLVEFVKSLTRLDYCETEDYAFYHYRMHSLLMSYHNTLFEQVAA